MRHAAKLGGFLLLWLGMIGPAYSQEVKPEDIRASIAKSLPLLQKAMQGSLEQRSHCFTCHHQGLGILTLVTARSRGLSIDSQLLDTQVQGAKGFLSKNKDRFLEGRGTGGEMDTAGYALWALSSANVPPDDVTSAVTNYLVKVQAGSDHWKNSSDRPPSESSTFTSTYLSVRGLHAFGNVDQNAAIQQRKSQVKAWLLQTVAEDTEEQVFRLRTLQLLAPGEPQTKLAADILKKTQQEDGGFSQLPGGQSDPYATGSALVALHEAGLPSTDQAYQNGLRYLLKSQREDGSWYVKSRSVPFQTYYESGYPHGKDQFISMMAGCWSTMALALSLSEQLPK